jgi:hypothetical protein
MESAVEVGDHFRVVDRRYVSRRYVSKPRCIPSFHPGNPVDFYGKAVIGLPMYLRSFLKSNLFTYRRTPRGLIGNTKESPSPDSRKRDLIFCFGKV